ncbi:uncharacterized protein PHALS_09982 [Plasmopara halstedii]|uniref:Uncharacterized protein n=1 Tax=Plasmopara halstedii TaxID=4781 RepID=A0A0P1AG67_PLAHL|nr:uncharacterized protein PHALS_09982 [Plasmopara halstedii]CEG39746.1 hypothetical protein PHALS_09982 [Plasmopara halstedii]|eukprot:XP_024576115.1 hypothetical protein PHALS_09982 [Plasmopara halstedii]
MTAVALQVADLFDVHAVEAPINRLVSALNDQAAQIYELQETLQRLQAVQRERLLDCKNLHSAVSSLELHLHATFNDTNALKQFQIVAQRHLEANNRQLQLKADRQEVHNANMRIIKNIEHLESTLRSELASLSLVQCLQTEQNELNEKMKIMEKQLVSKMDKSEATLLDSVLIQIRSFQPMASQLSQQLTNVHKQQVQVERSLAQLNLKCEARHLEQEKLQQHTNDIQQSLDDVKNRYQQIVAPQIQRLDDTTEQLNQTLHQVNTSTVITNSTLRTLSAKFHSSAGSFATQLQQQYRHFENAFKNRASRLEMETQLAVLSKQIATMASDTDHKALTGLRNVVKHMNTISSS